MSKNARKVKASPPSDRLSFTVNSLPPVDPLWAKQKASLTTEEEEVIGHLDITRPYSYFDCCNGVWQSRRNEPEKEGEPPKALHPKEINLLDLFRCFDSEIEKKDFCPATNKVVRAYKALSALVSAQGPPIAFGLSHTQGQKRKEDYMLGKRQRELENELRLSQEGRAVLQRQLAEVEALLENDKEKIADLQQENDYLRTENAKLNGDCENLTQKLADALEEKDKLEEEKRIAMLNSRLEKLRQTDRRNSGPQETSVPIGYLTKASSSTKQQQC